MSKIRDCFPRIKFGVAMTNPTIPLNNSPIPLLVKGGKEGFERRVLRWNYGFTLLELIVSFAIIGIIILIIIGAMRLGLRSVNSGEKRMASLERFRTSLNIIDSQIQSEIPLTYVEDVNTKYYFKGEREFMQFSTNYSIWGGEKGYVIVTYMVEPGENGKQVLYASENLVGLDAKRDTKLFDNFEEIYFEYFFKDPTEEEGEWVEQWTDDVNIPEKVRLHLIEGTRDLSIIIPFRARGSLSQTLAEQ
jgi:prepilin-type N-terminal cleavage/methylation domain-containing protein